MNLVVVKHPNDSGKYVFRIPEDVTIDAGTLVMVDTARGIQPAVCATGSFHADPEVCVPMFGGNAKNLKRVLSVLLENKMEWPDEPAPAPEADDD